MIESKRTSTPPASLAAETSWRERDVLEALHQDFYGKCYLCERAHSRPTFEVDHFVPRNEDATRHYDWDNLFPACEACNKRRDRSWRDGGYLNPCHDDIQTRLVQRLDVAMDTICEFYAAQRSDAAATNTATQLEHLHDTTDLKGKDLVEAIRAQVNKAYRLAYDYQKSGCTDQKLEGRLRRILSRKAPYTALIRSLFPDLSHLFD